MKNLLLVGFGNQAKSWALNLRDSGVKFSLALRKGPSMDLALKMGFETHLISDDFSQYKHIVLLTPDETHFFILENLKLKEGARIYYAHGFSVVTHELQNKFPSYNHVLLAPKAIASELRFQYEIQGKLGAVFSLEHIKDENKFDIKQELFLLASAIGITSGPYETTFENETYADLFSEQTILCSILPYVSNTIFNKLIQKGVEEETAYFEAWYEVKLIADTLIKVGPQRFFELISPNALAGSYYGKRTIIDSQFEKNIDALLEDIYSGQFQKNLEKTDMKKLREETNLFWESQPLLKTHQRLENELFN